MAAASKNIVLITGGNAGIGYEIVKKLASDCPDYHILMGSRDIKKGEAAVASLGAPTNVNSIQLDITNDESIDTCRKAIEQDFGLLDVLINNAGTAGRDINLRLKDVQYKDGRIISLEVPRGQLRELYTHCYSVNVTSAALLTEAMTPLLFKSETPRVVFISSGSGSIGHCLRPEWTLVDCPWYSATKSAMNYLAAYYAKKYPNWKSNSCDPGFSATGLNGAVLTEGNHPSNGAINAVRLATLDPDGETGTFTNKEGSIPW